MHADLETGSLHEALRDAGFLPPRGRATLAARAASPEDARLLGIPAGDAAARGAAGHRRPARAPARGDRVRYPADRYALDVEFEVEAARERSTSWQRPE